MTQTKTKKTAVKKSVVKKTEEKEIQQLDGEVWKISEQVLIAGDLSRLNEQDKVILYRNICQGLGLNPMTKPFDLIKLNGKEVLYANRNCTDQLRKIHGVNIELTEKRMIPEQGIYIVTARATLPNGRSDESTGAVSISGLKGEALCNALLKCETKAKRRVTLSAMGLSLLDETEIESIPAQAKQPVEIQVEAPAVNGHSMSPEDYAKKQAQVKAFPDEIKKRLGKAGFTTPLKAIALAERAGWDLVSIDEILNGEYNV